MLTKEVTSTTIKLAQLQMVDGQPQAVVIPDMVVLGNVNSEQAQKLAEKELGKGITVFGVSAETQTYEMPVAEFIKVATIKVTEPKAE